MTFGRVPARLDAHVQRGYPFRASIKMRDGSPFPASVEVRFDSGETWPATISGDSASWDVPAATVDERPRGERFELVFAGDVVWASGRAVEDSVGGFGGQGSVLVVPTGEGGSVLTSPAIKGDQGETPTLVGGTPTTLAPGEPVQFALLPEGDATYRLDLAVPAGAPGAPGGSDAATAAWIETGVETIAALDATRVRIDDLAVRAADHGAAGDGIADDTAALTAAIAAATTRGVPVVVQPGTYKVGAITHTAPVHAEQPGTVTFTPTGSMSIWQSVSGQGVTLRGITLDAQGLITSYPLQVASTDATVDQCRITDTHTALVGVEIRDNASNVTISRTSIDGCLTGVKMGRPGITQVRLDKVAIAAWRNRGVWIAGGTGISVRGVWITDCWITAPSFTSASDVRQPIQVSGVDTDLHQDVHIRGCVVEGTGHSWTNPVDFGAADLISLHRVERFSVVGNTISRGGDGGITIAMSCRKGTVSDNTVDAMDAVGIYLGSGAGSVRDITCTGNTVMNCGQNEMGDRSPDARAGMWAYNATGLVITGNRTGDDQAVKTQQYGITLRTGTSGVDLAGNNTRGNALGGVHSVGASGVNFGSAVTAYKPSDTIRNNTATLAADPHLVVTLDPDATYILESDLLYVASATADLSAGYYGPAGASLLWSPLSIDGAHTGNGSAATVDMRGVALATTIRHGGTTGPSVSARHAGRITTGATGGTFGVQWAQNLAEASDTRLLGGSWMRVTRVG